MTRACQKHDAIIRWKQSAVSYNHVNWHIIQKRQSSEAWTKTAQVPQYLDNGHVLQCSQPSQDERSNPHWKLSCQGKAEKARNLVSSVRQKCIKFTSGWDTAPNSTGEDYNCSPDCLVSWWRGFPLLITHPTRRPSMVSHSRCPPCLVSIFLWGSNIDDGLTPWQH